MEYGLFGLEGNDKVCMLEVVKNNGMELKYVSENLKNDKDVVLEAVKNNGEALQDASNELRNDKTIVLVAVKNCGWALEYASEEIRNDKTIVLEAVKNNEYALDYASYDLKNDKEVVLEAIKFRHHAIRYASKDIIDMLTEALVEANISQANEYPSNNVCEFAINYLPILIKQEKEKEEISKTTESIATEKANEMDNNITTHDKIQLVQEKYQRYQTLTLEEERLKARLQQIIEEKQLLDKEIKGITL